MAQVCGKDTMSVMIPRGWKLDAAEGKVEVLLALTLRTCTLILLATAMDLAWMSGL